MALSVIQQCVSGATDTNCVSSLPVNGGRDASLEGNGGRCRARTCDPLRVRQGAESHKGNNTNGIQDCETSVAPNVAPFQNGTDRDALHEDLLELLKELGPAEALAALLSVLNPVLPPKNERTP